MTVLVNIKVILSKSYVNLLPQVYAWPVMQTLFSEVFSKNEWLRLFDHIFTNPPGFFYHLVAAYSICCKSALMRTIELQDFKVDFLFHD